MVIAAMPRGQISKSQSYLKDDGNANRINSPTTKRRLVREPKWFTVKTPSNGASPFAGARDHRQ